MSFVGRALSGPEMIAQLAKECLIMRNGYVQPGLTVGSSKLPLWRDGARCARKLEYDLYY